MFIVHACPMWKYWIKKITWTAYGLVQLGSPLHFFIQLFPIWTKGSTITLTINIKVHVWVNKLFYSAPITPLPIILLYECACEKLLDLVKSSILCDLWNCSDGLAQYQANGELGQTRLRCGAVLERGTEFWQGICFILSHPNILEAIFWQNYIQSTR